MTRPPLFTFLEASACSRDLRDGPRRVATLIALTCAGTTGEQCRIDAGRIADDLQVSERTVWRHVEHLVNWGWLERTGRAKRGARGEPGTCARYRVAVPGSSATPAHEDGMSGDLSSATLTLPDDVSFPGVDVADDPESPDSFGESSATTTHNNVALFPSYGSTSAAAAREPADDDLPEPVEILRRALDQHSQFRHVRWDRLTIDELVEIGDLALLHGDAQLVKSALAAYRPEAPVAFARAWLDGWRHIRARPELVIVRPARCKIHSQDQPCSGCASDAKATGGQS